MKRDEDKTKSELIAELESLRAMVRGPGGSVGLQMNDATDSASNSSSADHDTINVFDWEYQHQERMKELQGIIGLGQLIDQNLGIHAFFNAFVKDIVPPSMQFPEHVAVMLTFDGKEYSNGDNPPEVSLTAPITAFSVQRGDIMVGYNKDLSFIPEFEQRLVNTYANMIGHYIARIEVQQQLRESERRYALATHSAGIGTWEWDIVSNEMTWDDRIFRLYGISEIPEQYGLGFWQRCFTRKTGNSLLRPVWRQCAARKSTMSSFGCNGRMERSVGCRLTAL